MKNISVNYFIQTIEKPHKGHQANILLSIVKTEVTKENRSSKGSLQFDVITWSLWDLSVVSFFLNIIAFAIFFSKSLSRALFPPEHGHGVSGAVLQKQL